MIFKDNPLTKKNIKSSQMRKKFGLFAWTINFNDQSIINIAGDSLKSIN